MATTIYRLHVRSRHNINSTTFSGRIWLQIDRTLEMKEIGLPDR